MFFCSEKSVDSSWKKPCVVMYTAAGGHSWCLKDSEKCVRKQTRNNQVIQSTSNQLYCALCFTSLKRQIDCVHRGFSAQEICFHICWRRVAAFRRAPVKGSDFWFPIIKQVFSFARTLLLHISQRALLKVRRQKAKPVPYKAGRTSSLHHLSPSQILISGSFSDDQ